MRPITSRLAATILLAGAAMLGSCATLGLGGAPKAPSVEHLTWCLVGDFDGASAPAPEAGAPIGVHVRPAPMIPNGVYFEEGTPEAPKRPFRQRVYVVKQAGGEYVLEAWTLKRPQDWGGATGDRKRLKMLIPSQINRAEGCDIRLAWDGERYTGGSTGTGCEEWSSGAMYMTTELSVGEDGFTQLERGFAPGGKQVWGPIGEPYVFGRIGG